MLTATLYFLGLAGFIVAALICLSRGKRAEQHVEVDLPELRTAAVCFLAGCRAADKGHSAAGENATAKDSKATWREMKSLWLQWYAHCRKRAMVKRKAMLSWGRTLVVCALLCLVGAYLEVRFDEPISLNRIFVGLFQ